MGTFDHLGDLRLVGVELERCEEAQRAQVEGHDWRNTLLQMDTGCTDSPVESEIPEEETHTHTDLEE